MNSHGRILTTHVGTAGVDPDVVWAELAALAQGTERASRRPWPRQTAGTPLTEGTR